MKNSLLCLCLLVAMAACSSDDDSGYVDKNFRATFSIDDLEERQMFYYYISGDTALIVAEIYDNKVYPIMFDARCPNKEKKHKRIPNIYYMSTGVYQWDCIECGAQYSLDKGEAINDIAKGTKLHKYNYNYNEQTGIFNVWW